jgi:transposase
LGEKLKAIDETRSLARVFRMSRESMVFLHLVIRWKKLMAKGGKEAIHSDDAAMSGSEVREFEKAD